MKFMKKLVRRLRIIEFFRRFDPQRLNEGQIIEKTHWKFRGRTGGTPHVREIEPSRPVSRKNSWILTIVRIPPQGRGVGGKVNLPLECSNTPDRVGGFDVFMEGSWAPLGGFCATPRPPR